MHGREPELAELVAAFDAAARGGTQLVLVEADTGMGKSRLLAEFSPAHACLRRRGARRLRRSDRATCALPRLAGHSARLLDVDLAAADTAQRAAVLTALGPEFAAQAALLNVVFPLNLPETEDLQAVTLQQRSQFRLALLVDLLRRAAGERTLLVSIEDARGWTRRAGYWSRPRYATCAAFAWCWPCSRSRMILDCSGLRPPERGDFAWASFRTRIRSASCWLDWARSG